MKPIGAMLGMGMALAGLAAGEEDSKMPPAVVATIAPEDLQDFESNPPSIRHLIESALELTKRNLGYKYGSEDPESGGMDCSGTIYRLLLGEGVEDVPRTASGQYVWARKAETFEAVVSRKADSFELGELKPGDLLFWSGTYDVKRDPPVTHSMIYLGRLKSDGRQVMFGASDGRTYGGKKMSGVSVFDFQMPKPSANGEWKSDFVGYATIPNLEKARRTKLTEGKSGTE